MPRRRITQDQVKDVLPVERKNEAVDLDRLQARIYAALVGGSDFIRTLAGEADVCRLAYSRSRVAVRIWKEQKAKEVRL